MAYLLASALCSVLVSVLLKLARRLQLDVGQAIAWNYPVAAILTWLLLRPDTAAWHRSGARWPLLLLLGALLPALFVALAGSVRQAGIVRSEVAQRLSLLISLLAAFVLFGEPPAPLKLAGLGLGVAALVAMLWRPAGTAGGPSAPGRLLYPLLVFLGFGLVDVLFKQLAVAGVPLGAALLAVFGLAGLLALAWQAWRWWRGHGRPAARHVLGGALLGLLNFGNILFYLRAHRALAQQPALVFAGMNLTVVTLGTLAGLGLFGERLSRVNLLGVVLAALAIGVLARAAMT